MSFTWGSLRLAPIKLTGGIQIAEARQPEVEDVYSNSTESYTSSEDDDDSESMDTGNVKELTDCGNIYHSVFMDTAKHAIEDGGLI